MENERPKTGIGVMIFKDGKILLHKRKGAHGAGEYSFPGGHLEYMESFEACARRETLEEAGITIKNVRFLLLSNLKDYAPKHYVHINFIADWESGEPQNLEPEKCEGWDWYSLDNIPEPCFKTMPACLEAYRTGKYFFDN
jgi:8-oxo-dGTP diphosphatase